MKTTIKGWPAFVLMLLVILGLIDVVQRMIGVVA